MIKNENLQFLSPQLQDIIRKNKYPKIDFKETRDKNMVPLLHGYPLHSLYYPLKEAKKIKITPQPDEALIAVGFGAGYHLTEITSPQTPILVVPTDYEILYNVLATIDLSKFFQDSSIKIVTADEIASHFDFFTKKSYRFIVHPVLERQAPTIVIETIKNIKNRLNPSIIEFNTQRKFGRLWLKNIIINIKRQIQGDFDTTPLTINKKPIVIVGAGPSLGKNIKQLHRFQERIFIAAADTAYRILYKHHIKADAIFSFDCQHITHNHFPGTSDKTRVFQDAASSLRINKPTTLLFSGHPILKLIEKTGFKPIYLPSSTMNIGGAIISFFATYFPGYPIVTAGIDYAILNHAVYSRGSYLDDMTHTGNTFFDTTENFWSTLLYKSRLTNLKNGWQETAMLKDYAKLVETADNASDISTLSTSPNSIYTHTEALEAAIEKANGHTERILRFDNGPINKNKIIELLHAELDQDPTPIYSYLMAQSQFPTKQKIASLKKDIIQWIN